MRQTPEASTTVPDTWHPSTARSTFPWGTWVLIAAGFTTALALLWAPSSFDPDTGWPITITATWISAALLTAVPWALAMGISYARYRRKNRPKQSTPARTPAPPSAAQAAPVPVPTSSDARLRESRGGDSPSAAFKPEPAPPSTPVARPLAEAQSVPRPEAQTSSKAKPSPPTATAASRTGPRRVTVTDAVNHQRGWTPADRQTARQVVAWAQRLDRGLYAYIPPSGEVAVLATSSGRRLATFRQGHVRVHTTTRPPLPGIRPGSQPRTWNLPLSRYRGV